MDSGLQGCSVHECNPGAKPAHTATATGTPFVLPKEALLFFSFDCMYSPRGQNRQRWIPSVEKTQRESECVCRHGVGGVVMLVCVERGLYLPLFPSGDEIARVWEGGIAKLERDRHRQWAPNQRSRKKSCRVRAMPCIWQARPGPGCDGWPPQPCEPARCLCSTIKISQRKERMQLATNSASLPRRNLAYKNRRWSGGGGRTRSEVQSVADVRQPLV